MTGRYRWHTSRWKTFTAFIASVTVRCLLLIPAFSKHVEHCPYHFYPRQNSSKLIDADGTTQDSLKKLADAYNGEQWKPALAIFLCHSYGKVVGDLNLETATPAMLRQRFQNNGSVEGGTIDMALRFYLSALKEADVKFSDHLVVRQRAERQRYTPARDFGRRNRRG